MFEYVNPGFILISAIIIALTLLMIIYEVGSTNSWHKSKTTSGIDTCLCLYDRYDYSRWI